jgi:PPP family 3-phenylpropionic acid transporter
VQFLGKGEIRTMPSVQPLFRWGLATRVSLVYFAYFFFLGISTPFENSWLTARGFGAHAGLLIGASLIAKTIGQPVLSYLADVLGRRLMLILSALASAIGTLTLVYAYNYFVVLALLVFAGFFIGPILALTDAVALSEESLNYGHVRLWGSLGFAVAVVAGGWLIDRLGVPLVIWLEVAGLAVLLAITFGLPKRGHERDKTRTRGAQAQANKLLGKFLVAPITWLFMLSVATLNASHAYYYSFSVNLWMKYSHFTTFQTSVLWFVGVLAEVLLLWVVGDRVPLSRAKQLLIFASVGGILRWVLMAVPPSLALSFPLQALHACTYAAMHLGAMLVLRRAVPPSIATTVMGIYAALVNGVLIGIVTYNLDPVYELLGPRGYLIMAALSAVGGVGVLLFARQWKGGEFTQLPAAELAPA